MFMIIFKLLKENIAKDPYCDALHLRHLRHVACYGIHTMQNTDVTAKKKDLKFLSVAI